MGLGFVSLNGHNSGRRPVLALDLATRYGWAEGLPGEKPRAGHGRFATEGASHEAIFWDALKWATARFQLTRYRLILIEAPLPSSFARGRTNIDTTTVLFGLPAVIGAVAFGLGQFNVKKAKPLDVRAYFLGRRSPSGKDGKRAVIDRCRDLGWIDPWTKPNDNMTDALALWAYGCACLEPGTKLHVEPLFQDALP